LFNIILGFGGLPPPEPLINPRRGSATGSYGLPVPPEWLRSQAEMRRGSKYETKLHFDFKESNGVTLYLIRESTT